MAQAASPARIVHPAGAFLTGEAAPADGPQRLVEGWAALAQVLADGEQQIIGLYLPGDIIGLHYTDQETALCSVVAVTNVTLIKTEKPDGAGLLRLLQTHHEYLMRQALRTAHKSAMERTADFLLEIHDRLADGGLADGNCFHLPLTQSVFAATLGMSTVHMNRTLMQLQRNTLIARRGVSVTLVNRARLAEIAQFRPLRPRPPGDGGSALPGQSIRVL